jgi:type VI secretion system secreted protein VgrG
VGQPMTTFATTERLWTVTTPLRKGALLLVGFAGHEGLSQLFQFNLDLVAPNNEDVPFEAILGQPVVVGLVLSNNRKRYFSGICSRISQGVRDATFTAYRMEVVPQFWLLTRRAQSRIFQHVTVPDILKKVLAGLDVAYEIQGTFQPRDYCVQYRETDFNFASRLMEEEGI